MWLQGLLVVVVLLENGLAWRYHRVSDEKYRPKNYNWRSGRDEFTREAQYYSDLESIEHPHGLYYRMVPPPDSSEENPTVPSDQSQNPPTPSKSFNHPNQDWPHQPPYQNYWTTPHVSQNPTQSYWQPTPPPHHHPQNYWQPTPPPQYPTQNYWHPTLPPQYPTQNNWQSTLPPQYPTQHYCPTIQPTVPSQPSQPCWPYQQQFCSPCCCCHYHQHQPLPSCQHTWHQNCVPYQPNPTPQFLPPPYLPCQYGNITTPGCNNPGYPDNQNPGNNYPGNTNPGNINSGNTNPGNINSGNTNPGNTYSSDHNPGYPTYPGNQNPGNNNPHDVDLTTIQPPEALPERNKATIPKRMAFNLYSRGIQHNMENDDKARRLGQDQRRKRRGYRLY